MRSISRLKVSTKLAGASIIIVAFVVAIIGSQLWGSSAVQTSTTNLARRAALARTLLEANAGVKGMQIGMLRLRTAYNAKDIADAQAVLVSSAAATTKAIDRILNTSSLESTRKAMTSFKQKIAEFNAYANTVAGLQTQMFELQAQEAKAGHDVAALAALKQKANALEAQEQQIGRGKVAPIAAEISTTATKLATRIAGHMDQDAVNAENTLHLVKYVGLAISLTSILILIGAALLGHRAIALPLRALVRSLRQMAQGEEVEITGIKRGDEIGDAARAVNDIKALLAEKARREAEEKAAADKARTQREAEQAARTAEERAEQEKRTAAERDAATQKAADEFQAAIGGIVNAAVAGDFSQRVDLQGKTGLVLNVGTAINSLCENVAMALDDLVGMLNGLAEGDLTKRITAHYEGSFALLKDNANMTAERIGSTIADIKATAREVTDASKEITTSTTDLSQRTEEQAASLEETSASMEEMAATVKKNAENAQAANQSAIATRKVADRGGEVVAQAVTAMAQIEESSRNISEIIVVIDEIARQTNLLALNAAVEAARAGDAGRGFAVVATEVRSLAQRSSQAAKDIKDLIVNSGGQVKEGVELVNRAGTALTEITESIKQVADLVSDIATASAEQSTGIDEVNRALTQMDEATQQNSALVEENAATAKTLESQAKAMDDRIAFFRVADSGQFGAWGQGRADMRSLPAAKAPSLASEPVPAARAQAKGASRSPVRRVQNAVAAAWKDF